MASDGRSPSAGAGSKMTPRTACGFATSVRWSPTEYRRYGGLRPSPVAPDWLDGTNEGTKAAPMKRASTAPESSPKPSVLPSLRSSTRRRSSHWYARAICETSDVGPILGVPRERCIRCCALHRCYQHLRSRTSGAKRTTRRLGCTGCLVLDRRGRRRGALRPSTRHRGSALVAARSDRAAVAYHPSACWRSAPSVGGL